MKKTTFFLIIGLFAFLAMPRWSSAQNSEAPAPLNTLTVPEPSNLFDFLKPGAKSKAIQLGKALFWDNQAGSDGQACASCHFTAGADLRPKNQLSPGLNGGNALFDPTASGASGGPNYKVTANDFPFHQRDDPERQDSNIIFDTDDVMSSQGVFNSDFIDIVLGSREELLTFVQPDASGFQVGTILTRRVEPRNTPTVINAVFNVENFWDGRAKFIFNGVNPFGTLESTCILVNDGAGQVNKVFDIKIDRGSLASQAVGPPLSAFEMSGDGRTFPKLGKKLLSLGALGEQVVHPDDSVLGPLSNDNGSLTITGINTTYAKLIRESFQEKYWGSNKRFDINKNEITPGSLPNPNDEFRLMEMNFSLFWGLAIQLYEATLVADETPFDSFQSGNSNALTEEQEEGLEIFLNQGRCINCHAGPEFTSFTVDQRIDNPVEPNGEPQEVIERMNMAEGEALYDGGAYNISVRPTAEDIGRGGTSPSGLPLSFTRFAKQFGQAALEAQLGIQLNLNPPIPAGSTERDAVDGAFKVATIRNTELTGPYFHNGGEKTLLDVVLFYTRGGNFPDVNIDNLDPDIEEIGHLRGKPDRQRNLALFMTSLTDERVRFERAPFDHPSLFVFPGHPGDENSVTEQGMSGHATDDHLILPPVGEVGRATPLPTFLNLSPAGPPPVNPVNDDIVIFATNSISVQVSADILSGNIVVNDTQLNPGGELAIGDSVTTPAGSDLKANSITVGNGAVIDSDVFYNTLTNNGGTINGLQQTPLNVPVFPNTSLPPFDSAPAGTQNITVAANDSITLDSGDYGDIVILPGGKLVLTGGIYNIRSLDAQTATQLLYDTFTEVRIEETFTTGSQATVAPFVRLNGVSIEDACGMLFYIAGIGASAAIIGTDNAIEANLYAPNGTLQLGQGTNATGTFLAKDVNVGIDVQLQLDSRFEFGDETQLAKTSDDDITNSELASLPKEFVLQQNYPNPFNPSTILSYELPVQTYVRLEIFNLLGQKVRTLVNGEQDAGIHKVEWNGRNDASLHVQSGVYVYRLKAKSFVQTRKMVLVK